MTSPRTSNQMSKTKVAIIGSGSIGTDLMIKILRLSDTLEVGAMVGIDPASDGLARAAGLKVPTTHEGVDGLIAMEHFDTIEIVFDATSAKAHLANAQKLGRTARSSSTSRPRPSARSSCRRSTSATSSTRAWTTSTWSPVAGRPPSPWSRPSPR
jgi:threonine dehydrogenase-like Zn-dependent dehydrogenase